MSAQTPLPNAKQVRELYEGLVGREITVLTGGAMVDPAAGALVGVYVDRLYQLVALTLLDVPLAARLGAALGLMPARLSDEAAELGALSTTLAENAAEVLNVTAALLNDEFAPHARLDRVYQPGDPLPNDIAPWVLAYVRRTDLTMDVAGYGRGSFSLLVI